MKMKNDCQVDYIKDAFDKLYNRVMPYIDLRQFSDADTAFKELDKKVHSEIYILKKCLAESDRAVEAGITRSKVLQERINDLEQRLNNECKHGEDLADVNGKLASENADLKEKTSNQVRLLEHSRITWRARAQHAEKEVEDLKKKISELEEENANLRVTPFDTLEALKKENSELRAHKENLVATCETRRKCLSEARKELKQYEKSFMEHYEENYRLRGVIDEKEKEINTLKKKIHELEQETADDAIRIKSLERANSVLRGDNKILWSKLEEADLDISKRPWHGDGNAMTDEQASYKSLVEAIEFQGKRIEELEAEKARLKEAYDIQETTIKRLKVLLGKEHKENVDLSPGHEFEFGDEVFVPWSDGPYMYVKSGMMYNPRTERLVYVGKDQDLKWFGEKFSIV